VAEEDKTSHRFFFTLFFLVGGYYSLKYYIYKKINSRLEEKIAFSSLKLGIFPPNIKIEDLNNFDIKDENLVSFKKVSVEVPFLSLFSKIKTVNLNIHNPTIILNEKILKKGKTGGGKKWPFEIDRINIIDGEVIFSSPQLIVHLLKVDLNSFTKSGKSMYKLTSPHLKVVMRLSKSVDLLQFPDIDEETVKNNKMFKIEGDMICEFRRQPTNWKISRFLWNTADSRITLNGRVFNSGTLALNATYNGTPENVLYPILKNLRPLGYTETKAAIKRDKKGPIYVEGDVSYNTFSWNGEVFENFRGKARWDSKDKQIELDAFFNSPRLETHLKLYSRSPLTRIEVENISVERVTRAISIDKSAPLGGVIKRGDVKIQNGVISGNVTLEPFPEPLPPPVEPAVDTTHDHMRMKAKNEYENEQDTMGEPGEPDEPKVNKDLFNVAGDITFRYIPKFKSVTFSTEDARAEFGTVAFLEGNVDPTRRTSLHINARANITDMGPLNKYTDYYIDLDLSPWELENGWGTLTLDLKKTGKKFFAESDLDIHDFTARKQPIEALTGHISTKESLTSAAFVVKDKEIKGNTKIFVGKGFFTMDFEKVAGESRKILKVLDIDISLTRWMTGDFHLLKKSGEPLPLVKGHFAAEQIVFYDFLFSDVKGELEFQGYTTLRDLTFSYNGGKGTADISIDYKKELYSAEGEIRGLDINRLHPEFHGKADIVFNGSGVPGHDPIAFDFQSNELYFYRDRRFSVKGTGTVVTDFSGFFRIDTGGDVINEISASPFTFVLNQENNYYTGSFNLTLTDINLLIPWGNNIGTMKLDGRIFGAVGGELTTEGHAVFNGRLVSFPNFPHALENFQGDVIFTDLNFTLRSLQGTIGGGNVKSSGYLNIRDNHLRDLGISLTGRDMNLYLIDRTGFNLNADLNLKYIDDRDTLLLSGHMDALSGIWRRGLDEGISFSTNPSLSSSGSKIIDMLEFDLKLTGNQDIRMENSFGNISGKFDLRLTGNKDFPILMGYIECREGTINFSDKQFDLIKAKLVFNNKFMIDPLLNIESESFIKNYRIKFNIKGTASRLKPELQSSPPLPPRDILTLISLGELFERPTSQELTSQIGTGTAGLLASGLTDQIKKRTKKIFGNYMLKIDPNIVNNIAGASFENTSRLIVGKEISKDFLVVYATNFDFSSQRQQVLYLQYHISPLVSLIGMRNEEGQISLDIRFRKRH